MPINVKVPKQRNTNTNEDHAKGVANMARAVGTIWQLLKVMGNGKESVDANGDDYGDLGRLLDLDIENRCLLRSVVFGGLGTRTPGGGRTEAYTLGSRTAAEQSNV